MPYSINKVDSLLKITIEQDTSPSEFNTIIAEISKMDGFNKVMLNLHNCYYVQSKILASMIALKKTAQKISAEFVLANVNEGVYQVLEMTNLLPYFHIVEDFSSYTDDEIIELFFNSEMADKASEYLVSSYNELYRQKLFEAMDMGDPLIQHYAILTIGRAHDFSAEEKIREYLKSDSGLVVKAAILVLGWFGDVSSKEDIYEYLKSDMPDVSEVAAASIALLSDETDSERIKELLKHGNPKVKTSAIKALSLINDDSSYKILQDELNSANDEAVRVQLAKAISSFNKPEVADILLSLFDDNFLKVREAAAGGLVRIKAENKVGEILSKVTDSDSWVGYFAAKALGEICKAECAEKLVECYGIVEENVKLAIIESLGKIKHDSSAFLKTLINDDNEDVRKEVLSSLYSINKDEALKCALAMYSKDESWLVRFKSVDIIAHMSPDGYKELLKERLEVEDNRYVKEKILSMLEEL